VFGSFLDEVAQRRIPLLLSLERGVTWRDVYQLLGEYPELTCLLCDIGIWGQDRFVWPLLERYPRVFVETSLVSLEAGGLEAGVKRFDASRFVFGSGFPVRYPEAALLDLLQADLPVRDREAIASANLERLLSEVRL
jgi:predicted TIM-barrel fold metal-dependent hydrolase